MSTYLARNSATLVESTLSTSEKIALRGIKLLLGLLGFALLLDLAEGEERSSFLLLGLPDAAVDKPADAAVPLPLLLNVSSCSCSCNRPAIITLNVPFGCSTSARPAALPCCTTAFTTICKPSSRRDASVTKRPKCDVLVKSMDWNKYSEVKCGRSKCSSTKRLTQVFGRNPAQRFDTTSCHCVHTYCKYASGLYGTVVMAS
mmetsp:Transcript_31732/g.47139  ORF Transcript_31732/g.47139 Transcript_31732/m.47139 type:complete len:202 (+) Transcript_31732:1307-1912(+)